VALAPSSAMNWRRFSTSRASDRKGITSRYGTRLLRCRISIRLMSQMGRWCSLIPGLDVKLSTTFLAGSTVLSAVGSCPPHDGVRRRWWINVESAVALSSARQASSDLTTATVPAGTSFPAVSREPCDLLCALRGGLLRRPVELSPIDPHAVQNDRELASDSDLGLAKPIALGKPHPPRLQRGPFWHTGQQHVGRFE
jgi:hypothetical protein